MKKAKSPPGRGYFFVGMELYSVLNLTTHLTKERARLVLNCLNWLKGRMAGTLKLFQRLLEKMASADTVMLLGLLNLRRL